MLMHYPGRLKHTFSAVHTVATNGPPTAERDVSEAEGGF